LRIAGIVDGCVGSAVVYAEGKLKRGIIYTHNGIVRKTV